MAAVSRAYSAMRLSCALDRRVLRGQHQFVIVGVEGGAAQVRTMVPGALISTNRPYVGLCPVVASSKTVKWPLGHRLASPAGTSPGKRRS